MVSTDCGRELGLSEIMLPALVIFCVHGIQSTPIKIAKAMSKIRAVRIFFVRGSMLLQEVNL
jgi:hypothetical protein